MSTERPKCQANVSDDATRKLSIYICDKHYEKGKAKLIKLIQELRAEEDQQPPPTPSPSPTPAPSPTPTPQPTPSPTPPPPAPPTPPPPTQGVDKFGIKKIFPDAVGERTQSWFMNMDNPTSDPRFKNEPTLTKESDGGWSSTGAQGRWQVRLEGWSESGQKKWLNCETTVYAQVMQDLTTDAGAYAFQVYRGGGHHSSSRPCEGAAYKGRVRRDKSVVIVKEVIHPDYTSNRGNILRLTKSPIGNYIGTKLVVYNLPEQNGKTPVKIEVWIDEDGMDANGVFVASRQNWKKAAETIDNGGWASGNGGGCPPLDKHNTTNTRRPDEIFNMPGGTEQGNLAAYRTDNVKSKIKYFSIREITQPSARQTAEFEHKYSIATLIENNT